MFNERPINSTDNLDRLDIEWWNQYSNTIELIWAQSPLIRKCLRNFYVKKIKKFFNKDKKVVTILELACGSGWVGRMIVGKELYVEGIDSSINQINTAKKEAQLNNTEKYCTYKVADVFSIHDQYDGILIHSFLYILSQNELNRLFQQISKFRKNIRVFIHEAVFMETIPPKTIYSKIMYRITNYYLKFSDSFIQYVKLKIEKTGTENKELINSLNEIDMQSQKYNTILSPKGVPFKEKEIFFLLDKYFHIDNYYLVNKYDLIIAQHLMKYNITSPSWIYKSLYIRFARCLDKIFFKLNLYRYSYRNPYIFTCFELRSK